MLAEGIQQCIQGLEIADEVQVQDCTLELTSTTLIDRKLDLERVNAERHDRLHEYRVSLGRLFLSKNLSISSELFILLAYSCL